MLREVLADVRVRDVMRPFLGWSRPLEGPLAHAKPDELLVEALPRLASSQGHDLAVVEDDMLVGKIFEEDVVRVIQERSAAYGLRPQPRHA